MPCLVGAGGRGVSVGFGRRIRRRSRRRKVRQRSLAGDHEAQSSASVSDHRITNGHFSSSSHQGELQVEKGFLSLLQLYLSISLSISGSIWRDVILG